LAFLLVVAGTVGCVFNSKDAAQQRTPADQMAQGVSLEIPDARWEPLFFEALEVRTNKIGLANLRRTVLPENVLEVRFW
jgi:hypothetical protein